MRYDYYMGMKNSISEDFKLLTARNIIDILDGDTKFGAFTFANGKYFVIAMPYLSGSMLCDISTQFGFVVRYYFDTTNDKKQNKKSERRSVFFRFLVFFFNVVSFIYRMRMN